MGGLAERLAEIADRLRGNAAAGLHHAENMYDRERFAAVRDAAIELLALATGDDTSEFEPLRDTVWRHVTPLATADAAVVDEAGRMLLIRRSDNGMWAMPGGACEVGETPAENAVREAREETGVRSKPVRLVGVFDSRLAGARTRHHLYQLLFLCRPTGDAGRPSHPDEASDMGWFGEDELPTPLDPGHVSRIPIAFASWRGERSAFFDGSD